MCGGSLAAPSTEIEEVICAHGLFAARWTRAPVQARELVAAEADNLEEAAKAAVTNLALGLEEIVIAQSAGTKNRI
jgi:hypothetical protein